MQLSSTWWLVSILVGAVLVAAGNLNFSIARDREREIAASEKALGLLQLEIKNNISRIAQLRKLMANGTVSSEPLETTAWVIVSNGGLLTRLDQPTMGRLLEAYYLVNLAETYRQQIVERSIGVASALATLGAVTQQYMAFLLKTIDTAEPKLNEIIALSKTRGA